MHSKAFCAAVGLCALMVVVSGQAAWAQPQEAEVLKSVGFLPSTVSTSRQFIVYHDDAQLRSVIARNADKIKQGWLEMVGERDHWKLPIAIHLSRPETRTAIGEYARLKTYESEVGIHFELNVVVNDAFSGDRFAECLITALYLEYAYREKGRLDPNKKVIELPQWLITGTSTYIRGNKADIPPDLFDSLIRTDQLLSLREFLDTKPASMDDTTKKVYSSYAECFVNMLRSLPGGKAGMLALVKELPDLEVLTPDNFFEYFPALEKNTNSLEKWWTLNLAKSSTLGSFRMLDAVETEERLAQYLKVDVPESDGQHVLEYGLEEWKSFRNLPNAKLGLALTAEKLAHLSVVCSPLFAPVINDYLVVVEQIVNMDRKLPEEEITQKLSELSSERPLLLTKAQDVQDYLNWYEATKIPQVSGAFDEYLRISRAPLPIYQMRHDRLTAYMNAIEYRRAVNRQPDRERQMQSTDPVLKQDERFQENIPVGPPRKAALR